MTAWDEAAEGESAEPRHTGLSRRGFLSVAAVGVGAAVIGAPALPASARTAGAPSDVPSALMTALRDDAVAVPSGTPRLWWEVPVLPQSRGEVQSAYEVQMTRDPRGFVLGAHIETARATSSASTAIAWPFAALPPRGLAFWRVRCTVGSGAHARRTDWSAPERVVLGPMSDADWTGSNTIWAPTQAVPSYADAVFTSSIQIQALRAGIFLRTSTDLKNGYMWQLNAGSPGLLRRHILVNGTYTVMAEQPLSVDIPTDRAMTVRIEANGTTVTTSIDGTVVDTATGIVEQPGAFGYRTGSTESFWGDDVTITDLSGKTLYTNDFSTAADLPSFGSLDNGRLLVGKSTAGLLGIPAPDNWALLRREFTLPAGHIAGAYLYASAQSPLGARQHVYRAWCNGTHVGVGPSRAMDAPHYQGHDVTSALRAGRGNVLAVQCWTQTQKQFHALLDVHYTDGRVVTIGSDTSWQARGGGSWLPWSGSFNNSYYTAPNEGYDARHEPIGWHQPGYRATDFSAAAAAGTQLTGLTPGASAAIAQVTHQPAAVVRTAPGVWRIDTGRELTAGLRLSLRAPAGTAGTTVELRLGEELNADGSVRYQLRAGTTYREVWTLRDGEQAIEHWGYRNFRWAQLITDPALDLTHAVTLLEQVVPQPARVATFSSSDADLDTVWGLCAYSIAANRQDLHMDSPTRERDAYEGDLVVHGRGEMANTRSYDIVRQTNRYLLRHPQWPTEYRFMSITTAWEEYLETGDPDALIADFALHMAEQDESLLDASGFVDKSPTAPTTDIVDWPDTQRDGYVFTNVNTVVNAWQYQAFVLLAQASMVAGRPDLATNYQSLASTMRDAMNAKLFDTGTGAYFDGLGTQHQAQHASAYPLALGVTPDDQAGAVADWLAANTANPVRMSANAVQWLLEALFRGGRADAALDIMTSRRDASWLAMIETWGATQTMEAWSPTVKSNTTFSHPWASAPANIVPRYLLGVRVVDPGGARIAVAPQSGGLARATGTVATARGLVGVDIEQSPAYRVTVTVPGNTTGTLSWPLAGHDAHRFNVRSPLGHPPVSVDGTRLVVPLVPGTTEVTAGK